MKTKISFFIVSLFLLFSATATYAGVNIVVLGSSTAADGSGWVTKYANYLKAKDASHTVINLSKGGYTTYKTREDGFQLPAGKESQTVDTERNITKALSYFPDIIIFAFPSNDYSNGNTTEEIIANYNAMIALAKAYNPNVKCYVTSAQPTNFSVDWINGLMKQRDAIKAEFTPIEDGGIYIDFWTPLANENNNLKDGYNKEDGQHLTDAGQTVLFEVMCDAQLLKVWGYDYAETESSSQTLQNPVKINFGNVVVPSPWNNTNGAAIADLLDTEGRSTGIATTVLAGIGVNSSGVSNTTTVLDMPNDVSRTFCYKGTASPMTFSIKGLSNEIGYKFTVYASRNDAKNSSATYTLTGSSVHSAVLNAAQNATEVLVFDNISPNDNGEVAVSIEKTADNTMGFTYISAMMIEPIKAEDEGDYAITKAAMENGDVLLSKTKANENEVVSITVIPAENFELNTISVMNGDVAVAVAGEGNVRTFSMPAGDVTVSASFTQTKFNVVKDAGMNNGYISILPEKALEGQTVALAAMPAENYVLDGDLTVAGNGGNITLTSMGNNTWTFTMPAENVTVSASFLQTIFNVVKANMTGGDVVVSPEKSAEGEIITLTVIPNENYVLDGELTVMPVAGGDAIALTPDVNDANKYTFAMPAYDVKVSASFRTTVFNVTKASMTGGDILLSATEAGENEQITLTVVPEQAYEPAGTPVVTQVLTWKYEAEDAEIELADGFDVSTVMTNEEASGGKYLLVRKGSGVKFNINIPESGTYNVYAYGGGNRSAVFYIDETWAIVNAQPKPNWNGRYDRSLSGSSATSNKILITEREFTAGSHYVYLDNKNDPAGYELQNIDCIEIERVNPPTVALTVVDDLVYTFNMPASDVIVSAAFTSLTPFYTITKANMLNGDVVVSKESAEENEEITLTIVPNQNFSLQDITVISEANAETINLVDVDEATRTFIMPASDVTISAKFNKGLYAINKAVMTDGDVSISPEQQEAGETVALTIIPNEGYELDVIKLLQRYEAEEAEVLNEYPGAKADVIIATETASVSSGSNASGEKYMSTRESCLKFHITIPEDGYYNLYAYLLGTSGNREALFYIDCSWYIVQHNRPPYTWNERHVVNCIGDVNSFNKKDIVLNQYLTVGDHYVLLDAGDAGAPGYWNIDCIDIEKVDGSMVELSGSDDARAFTMPACDLVVAAAFKEKGGVSTDVKTIEKSNLNVFVVNKELYVDGLVEGELYSLYTTDGKLLFNGKAAASRERLPINQQGVYILINAGNRVKIAY